MLLKHHHDLNIIILGIMQSYSYPLMGNYKRNLIVKVTKCNLGLLL